MMFFFENDFHTDAICLSDFLNAVRMENCHALFKVCHAVWQCAIPTSKKTAVAAMPYLHDIAATTGLSNLVPVAGVEPARPCGHGILNPGRLPIPPHRHGNNRNSISDFRSKVKGAIQIIPKYRDNGRLCGEADARSADNGGARKPRQSDEKHE